ncbi:phage major capsid protein [Xanthobacter autotrophicus]|uniref:phage major capsid protein n=1 Tax=Xanthobacter autotrophicus TaxID=280 RepID=UPI003726BE94
MTKHFPIVELKDADPVDAVTAALDDLTKSVDERLKAFETKSAGGADAGELDALKASIAKIEARLSRPGIIVGKSADETKAAERKCFAEYLRYGDKHMRAEELKTLQVSDDTRGGYFAPKEVSGEFIRDLVQHSPIRGLTTVRLITAPSISYPKRTGITNAKWKGELQSSEPSEPSFGQVEITARELKTHVPISNDLLADAPDTVISEVNLALAEDFGKKEGYAFLHGDGVIEPMGLLVDPDVPIMDTEAVGTYAPSDLINMLYSLPAAYRQRGTWLMNSNMLAKIRRWKGDDGAYVWQPSIQAGQPETILGRPVVEAVDMPDAEEGAFPILFGDIATGYRIVDRGKLSTWSNPYVLATEGITLIHATERVGGAVIQPKALKKLRIKPTV